MGACAGLGITFVAEHVDIPAERFADRRLLVGVTGGIAAYKTCFLVSALAQAGASVTVLMTRAATRFVAPLTFEALSGRPVYTSMWQRIEAHDPQHVALARAADAMVVAPCSMNCMARLAGGFADDVVTLAASAIEPGRAPVLLAPAMNESMWRQPATQRSLERLREDGRLIVGPESGWQACRTVGQGRMSAPEAILEALADALAD